MSDTITIKTEAWTNTAAELADLRAEARQLRRELGRYSMDAGHADHCRGLARAAVAALGLEWDDTAPVDITQAIAGLKADSELYQRGYDLIGAMDISNYLARCREAGQILEG